MMISVTDAKILISENCQTSRTERIPIEDALGYVLAADVLSPIDTPPFDNAAMDGYAFSLAKWDGKSPLKVIAEAQPGSEPVENIAKHEAIRIFTGAAVPGSIDTVVMQEKVIVNEDLLYIKDEQLTLGRNIRGKGSQTKKGSLALSSGHHLTPASISFLSGLGIPMLEVFSKPDIAIIVTGRELVPPGKPLRLGEIYESNGYGLSAACQSIQIEPIFIDVVGDEVPLIVKSLQNASDADIIIMTGGASVGEYDLVPKALEKYGVEKIFHSVKQRPGKPFYFGKAGETLVFGLPGNPAAVLTCFYEYIVPAIETFTKRKFFATKTLKLSNSYSKKPNFTYFLKGKTNGHHVEILDHQQSYLVNSFAHADCLIHLEENKESYETGDEVEVLMIG